MGDVTNLVDTKTYRGTTANCPACKGQGQLWDDFNEPGVYKLMTCATCHNVDDRPAPAKPGTQTILPTQGQLDSIARLIVELEELGDAEIHGLVAKRISGYDFQMAAKCVAKLQLRKAQRIANQRASERPQTVPTSRYPDVPAGRYAVASRTGNNDLDFFHVTKGSDRGRWKGYTFVTRIAGGEEYPVRGNEARQALQAIVDAGIHESGALYGQEVGACFNCHIRLTRKYSRGMGYGPDCADNLGLPFDHAEYARSPKTEEEELS